MLIDNSYDTHTSQQKLAWLRLALLFSNVVVFASSDFSFCQNEPCANGGTCRRNYTAVEKPNATSLSTYYWYSCQCAPGFAGNNCQTQLQSWTQNCSKQQTALCLNGATCLVNMTRAAETESKVVCTCPPGFSGLFCSNDDSVCSPNPCLNGEFPFFQILLFLLTFSLNSLGKFNFCISWNFTFTLTLL